MSVIQDVTGSVLVKVVTAIVFGAAAVALAWITPYARGLRLLADPRTETSLIFWAGEDNRALVTNLPDQLANIEQTALSNAASIEQLAEGIAALNRELADQQVRIEYLARPTDVVVYSRDSRIVEREVPQGGTATVELVLARTAETVDCKIIPELIEHFFIPVNSMRRYRTNTVGALPRVNVGAEFEILQFEIAVPGTMPLGTANYFITTYYDCPFLSEGEEPVAQTSIPLTTRVVDAKGGE